MTEAKAAETLRNYVVTPQLAGCFDNALAFIRSAIDGRSSKAAYLHGSFGSGKSHFMAVLYLLLQGSSTARSLSELASVVAEHDRWIQGKKFLLVPFHMIAARSTESAIFGQYVEYVRRLHPDAPVPGVYLAEPLFDNAHRLREQMGDETFFAQLNTQTASVDAGWGGLAAAWDATAFGRATAAPPGDEERIRLVSDLVETLLPAFQNIARAEGEAFVSLDEGLSILDRHARDLGYDALIFFLDELILWLASNAADLAFVSREGQKLAKLVEAQQGNRPIPLVSFVARQRDLRELVGDHVPGAQQLAFADVLEHQKGRFHLITLEDRNLPVIAEKRILAPKDDAARQELDGAFAESSKVRDNVMQTLLTSSADPAMFRQVYPFTPALVQTLVAVSSVLQRERTALKVMLLLLVSQRDTLTLGQLVPVGDLYDVIAEGDEAFTSEMREYFDQAKRLYQSTKVIRDLSSSGAAVKKDSSQLRGSKTKTSPTSTPQHGNPPPRFKRMPPLAGSEGQSLGRKKLGSTIFSVGRKICARMRCVAEPDANLYPKGPNKEKTERYAALRMLRSKDRSLKAGRAFVTTPVVVA